MKAEPTPILHEQEILNRNRHVSTDLVVRFNKLEGELLRLGVDTRPRFTISHPLGGKHLLLSDW